jgi:hypothetical protein
MAYMKKSKFRRPGAPSNRRKMAEPDEFKMEHEQELSAGPKKESVATGVTAFEERPVPTNNSPSSGDNHLRLVRKMDDKENASPALFEGFSDVTKTLFSPESAKKVAALWIDNSEKAVDQALKLQAKATEWSRNTMFAPIFEMQNSIARSYVEISARTARRFWQLE